VVEAAKEGDVVKDEAVTVERAPERGGAETNQT
jgi:hypothetical protein